MNAEEYFNKEYGKGHIDSVVNMSDTESLYGLMEEYANLKLKESEVSEEEIEKIADVYASRDEHLGLTGAMYSPKCFVNGAKWMQSKLNKK